jgi:hypothetical protein
MLDAFELAWAVMICLVAERRGVEPNAMALAYANRAREISDKDTQALTEALRQALDIAARIGPHKPVHPGRWGPVFH